MYLRLLGHISMLFCVRAVDLLLWRLRNLNQNLEFQRKMEAEGASCGLSSEVQPVDCKRRRENGKTGTIMVLPRKMCNAICYWCRKREVRGQGQARSSRQLTDDSLKQVVVPLTPEKSFTSDMIPLKCCRLHLCVFPSASSVWLFTCLIQIFVVISAGLGDFSGGDREESSETRAAVINLFLFSNDVTKCLMWKKVWHFCWKQQTHLFTSGCVDSLFCRFWHF